MHYPIALIDTKCRNFLHFLFHGKFSFTALFLMKKLDAFSRIGCIASQKCRIILHFPAETVDTMAVRYSNHVIFKFGMVVAYV